MKYDSALDGLRAVAVLSVATEHLGELLAMPLAIGGWVGVDVFFVLSGFLITAGLVAESDTTGTIALGRFYARRMLRLAPALGLMLVAAIAVSVIEGRQRHDAIVAAVISAAYLSNWVAALDLAPMYIVKHTWSLATEEQFYLLWPLVILMLRGRARIVMTVVLILGIIVWRNVLVAEGAPVGRTYYGFDTHADGLSIGCVMALAGWAPRGRRVPALVSLAIVAAFTVFVAFGRYDSPPMQAIGLTVSAGLGAALLWCARRDGWLRTALSWPPAVFVGRMSYGFYLWHYPVMIIWSWHLPQYSIPLALPTAFAIATLSFYLVERKFLTFKDRLRPHAPADLRHALSTA